MAEDQVDIQRLIVSLEASTVKYERALTKAMQTTGSAVGSIETALRRPQTAMTSLGSTIDKVVKPRHLSVTADIASVTRFQSALNGIHMPHLNFEHLKAGIGGLAAGFGLDEIRKLSDEWTLAGNKIAAAGVNIKDVPIVLEQVSQMAERSRTSLEQAATVYSGMSRAAHEFGASQAEVAIGTETVIKALTLSGSTTQQIEGALVDLVQGLQRGVLQGQELRALLGEVPQVAQAIAKEFHVSVGEVKQLGEEGKLTAERVFKALVNAAPEVDRAFANTKSTVSQAFQQLETAATRYVGQSQGVGAATSLAVSALQSLGRNFSTVADGAAALGLVLATRMIANGLTPMIASLAAGTMALGRTAAAHIEFSNVVGTSIVRMGAASIAARGLSAALALVGGPWGAALLGATAVITYFVSESQKAEERAHSYAQALAEMRKGADDVSPAIKSMADRIKEASEKMADVQINQLSQKLKLAEADAQTFKGQLMNTLGAFETFSEFGVPESGLKRWPEVLKLISDAANGDAVAALKAENALAQMANSDPDFQRLANALNPLLEKLAGVRAAIVSTKAEIAGIQRNLAEVGAPKDTSWAGKLDVEGTRTSLRDQKFKEQRDLANDDTDAKVRKRAAEIMKEANGLASFGQAYAQAKKLIEIEDSGSGGSTRHKKTDEEKAADKLKAEIQSLEQEARAAEAEAGAWGKSNAEKRTAIELAKLNVGATSEEGQKIGELIGKIEASKSSLSTLQKSGQAVAQASDFMRDGMASALDDIVVKGEKADQVFKKLLQSILSATLKAAVFGTGPFGGAAGGGLLGPLFTSLGKGGGGGIFSSLFGGGMSIANTEANYPGAGFGSWAQMHTGGVVGSSSIMRQAPMSMIATAPRFHTGLTANEFPAILQQGEHVLTAAQAGRTASTIAGLTKAAGAVRSATPRSVEQHFHLNGTMTTEDGRRMAQAAAQQAVREYDTALLDRVTDKQSRSF